MSNCKVIRNMNVVAAGYKYYGHFRKGELTIIFEGGGCCCSVKPKDDFNLYNLFKCFDIDCEDGKYVENIVGKYCRVHFDDKGYPIMIQHITKDNITWIDKGDNNVKL